MVDHSCFSVSHQTLFTASAHTNPSPEQHQGRRRPRSSTISSSSSPCSRQSSKQAKIFTAMKPIVSAAAAALLIMSGRRGGTSRQESSNDLHDSTEPNSLPPLPPPHDEDDDVHVGEEIDGVTSTVTTSATSSICDDDDDQSQYSDTIDTPTNKNENLIINAIRSNTPRIPRFSSPADWDWSDIPDDKSIWETTAAILGGARSRSPTDDGDDDDDKLTKGFRETMDTLSAALRGLSEQSFTKISKPDYADTFSEDDSDADETNDFRPLIAVTIGVTLFLLTRSAKVSRRQELEQGTMDGSIRLDEDDLTSINSISGANRKMKDYSIISNMRLKSRNIVIVTTAALPWMTGTSINPLLRAIYLSKAGHTVALVVPWLESPEDQKIVYPRGVQFQNREDQKRVILKWANDQIENIDINIIFYEGIYSKDFGSILPLGDITTLFETNSNNNDIVILEEPEHLTWFHTGKSWTNLFKFCVGVVHTNYLEYAKKYGVFGPQRALFLNFLNKWVCRSYCHRIIKLSDAVQTLPNSVTCNVHGVRNKFLDIGRNVTGFEKNAYFLGKVLWTKGYLELCEALENHYDKNHERLSIDFFGSGPDLNEVKQRCKSKFALANVQVHGFVIDHASEYLQKYKVYVNPSKSDVVCTATAEALAMGKFVICLKHPSNEFFSTFDNCLIYETQEEFSTLFEYAISNQPRKLSSNDLYRLSWEAATERFYDAAYVAKQSRTGGRGRVDSALALTHKTICATLVNPPANLAVRARYKREKRSTSVINSQGDDNSVNDRVGSNRVPSRSRSERASVR